MGEVGGRQVPGAQLTQEMSSVYTRDACMRPRCHGLEGPEREPYFIDDTTLLRHIHGKYYTRNL